MTLLVLQTSAALACSSSSIIIWLVWKLVSATVRILLARGIPFYNLFHGNPVHWWLTHDTSTEATTPEWVFEEINLGLSCLNSCLTVLKMDKSSQLPFNPRFLGKTQVSYTVFIGVLSHKIQFSYTLNFLFHLLPHTFGVMKKYWDVLFLQAVSTTISKTLLSFIGSIPWKEKKVCSLHYVISICI